MISSDKPHNLSIEEQLITLQQAQEVMGVFFTEVSSEVRTPLTAITSYTELMLTEKVGPINEKQTEFLRSILKYSKNLLEIFEYLFEMQRAVSGNLLLNVKEVDLNQLLQQIKSDTIQYNVPHELPKIWADYRRIREAVIAIIAVATGPFYDVKESQTILTVNHDDTWILLNITTIGETPRYFRNHPDPMLFLSRAIIETHGGQIQIEKQAEDRLEITFTLPINQNKPAPSENVTFEWKKPVSKSSY